MASESKKLDLNATIMELIAIVPECKGHLATKLTSLVFHLPQAAKAERDQAEAAIFSMKAKLKDREQRVQDTSQSGMLRPQPSRELPNNRKRRERSESPTMDDSHRSPSRKRRSSSSKTVTPVCGRCAGRGIHRLCDGKAKCGECVSSSTRLCVYNMCNLGDRCPRPKCSYLHPHQYDPENDESKRVVAGISGT